MNLGPHQSTADAVFAAALHARLLTLGALTAELDVFMHNCVAGPHQSPTFSSAVRTFREVLGQRVAVLEAREEQLAPISQQRLIRAGFAASTSRQPNEKDVGRLSQL